MLRHNAPGRIEAAPATASNTSVHAALAGAFGATPADAKAKTQALALRVLAERLEHGEARQ